MPAAAPTRAVRLRRTLRDLLPRGHAWWLVLGGCVFGLLLFGLLWLGRPAPDADLDPESVRATADGALLPPLPAPLPAGDASRGFEYADPQVRQAPVQIDAHVPQVAPAEPPVAREDTVMAPTAPVAAADLPSSLPRPVTMPQPDYPRASLRRGEQGEVLLLVKVGADGRVDGVDVIGSSQHRRLDRAAVSAVRRWRFEPAQRDGQPVAGELRVPISFAPAG
ncbi:MAG: energy transducer TonB [Luteimonas sp.]